MRWKTTLVNFWNASHPGDKSLWMKHSTRLYLCHSVHEKYLLYGQWYQNLILNIINHWVNKSFISSKRGRSLATVVSSDTLFFCFSERGARGESFKSYKLNFSLTSAEYDAIPPPGWAAMLAIATELHSCAENGTAFIEGSGCTGQSESL